MGSYGVVESGQQSALRPTLSVMDESDDEIQKLKELLKTIERAKHMWQATFDAISEPVLIVNNQFQVVRANLAAATVCGVNVRAISGQHCYQVLAGRTQPCMQCPMPKTLKGALDVESDLEAFANNRQYHVNAYPLPEEPGVLPQVVLHYRDLTKEKELQRKLFQSEKMAAIGTLAGGVAHEVNNPLGGILAFTQLVMKELGSDHSCYGDLKEVEEATLRCKRIVQDLLDFSRQNYDEDMAEVDLNAVIRKVDTLTRVQTKSNRIQTNFDLKELPPIWASYHKLQQVFLNLITNAIHAMKEGGTLTINTWEEDGQVKATVRDNGSGIKAENMDKIFDPYFTTKENGLGTGLGLSISYGIVEEHKGKMEVSSQWGDGTCFTLSFPVRKNICGD